MWMSILVSVSKAFMLYTPFFLVLTYFNVSDSKKKLLVTLMGPAYQGFMVAAFIGVLSLYPAYIFNHIAQVCFFWGVVYKCFNWIFLLNSADMARSDGVIMSFCIVVALMELWELPVHFVHMVEGQLAVTLLLVLPKIALLYPFLRLKRKYYEESGVFTIFAVFNLLYGLIFLTYFWQFLPNRGHLLFVARAIYAGAVFLSYAFVPSIKKKIIDDLELEDSRRDGLRKYY